MGGAFGNGFTGTSEVPPDSKVGQHSGGLSPHAGVGISTASDGQGTRAARGGSSDNGGKMGAPYGPPPGAGPVGGPPPGWGPAPPRGGMSIGKIAAAVTTALGFIILIMGFLNSFTVDQQNQMTGAVEEVGVQLFQSSGNAAVIVLFAGGLVALGAFFPNGGSSAIAVFALSLAGGFGILFGVLTADLEDNYGPTASLGAGALMALIFGIVQIIAATIYWLSEAGVLGGPRRPAQGYGGGGGYSPQGGYGGPQGPGNGQQGGPGQGGYGFQGYPGQGGPGQGGPQGR